MTLESFGPQIQYLSQLTTPAPEPARSLPSAELLPLLWSGLKRGCFRIGEHQTDARHVSMTIVHVAKVPPAGVTLQRSGVMLEQVLLGQSQKSVSYTHNVAPSTVALSLKHALERMGFFTRFTRVPLVVPLLAHAAHHPQRVSAVVEGDVPRQPAEQCVVRVERSDGILAEWLTASELGVATALLEGKSYEEIAELRGTALRTIANQMSSIGRKLATRGRFDLLLTTVTRARPTIRITGSEPPESGTKPALAVQVALVG